MTDRSGDKYGLITVISFSHMTKDRKYYYNCRCDCGTEKKYVITNLRNGNTKSCGCYNNSSFKSRVTKHNLYYTSEYKAWNSMKNRCLNSNCKSYKNYGERGVKICDRWKESFQKKNERITKRFKI